MNIIYGKGSNRQIISLPHASAVKAAPVEIQRQVLNMVCNVLNVKEKEGWGGDITS